MPLYGDYDWLDSHGERAERGLDRSKYFTDKIVKCSADTDRARWEQGSPLLPRRADAPPFFVVHGARDTMLLVEDARHFAAALQSASRSPVAYAELPGSAARVRRVPVGAVRIGDQWHGVVHGVGTNDSPPSRLRHCEEQTMDEFMLESADGVDVFCRRWLPPGDATGRGRDRARRRRALGPVRASRRGAAGRGVRGVRARPPRARTAPPASTGRGRIGPERHAGSARRHRSARSARSRRGR